MVDTPPPLPAPLKEGDEGPPLAIYALCGPATDDRDVGVAIRCGYRLGPTITYEVGGVLLIKQHGTLSWISKEVCGYNKGSLQAILLQT